MVRHLFDGCLMGRTMTEKINFQAFMADFQEVHNREEYEVAFNAHCDLERLEADRARCAAAAERSTGLERESNIRQMAEIDTAIDRVQALLGSLAGDEPAHTPRNEAQLKSELGASKADDKALSSTDQGDDRNGQSAATWQDQIREVADKLHRNDLKAGAWSSTKDLSERLAAQAIKLGIRGPHGQLTAANILREALQGSRWKRPEN